ncbi:heterokaryon incompatibility [Macroventuria anomochaeta]|uniref:Heterokaryon incompatibility n=1 Tax=Macroventuria anomochaeta TaxID=301207 RepID=A0ACB6RWF2_9PLEO|nr:heterokaryon incompatibility [Macroventuria anomochaeta]KAF2626246.1 heterokaryon incompatibility [Macroventuria anomochaeta]
MLNGIPRNNIPRIFRHAIGLVYDLGIDYLWIDSYCIIQGDQHDWEVEFQKMVTMFQNSYITIAATAAQNNEA